MVIKWCQKQLAISIINPPAGRVTSFEKIK